MLINGHTTERCSLHRRVCTKGLPCRRFSSSSLTLICYGGAIALLTTLQLGSQTLQRKATSKDALTWEWRSGTTFEAHIFIGDEHCLVMKIDDDGDITKVPTEERQPTVMGLESSSFSL